jgi:hypothetical protein
VVVFDRNFPGHKIITAILDAGGHVVARAKSDLALPLTPGGWLADGSRLSFLNAPGGKPGDRLPVAVAEHNAVLPCGDGQEVSETCTLITTLLDHHAVDAGEIRGAYQSRWTASETTFGGGQDHHRRRRGPHLRAGAALGHPAAGHRRVLGLDDRHPAGPRQRRCVPGHTNRGRACTAAARGQRPGHHRPGVLHRS